jgi:prevent-host-death family protein
MKKWPVQDAKARFSEMLEACTAEGPQLVSKRGTVTAVLVSIAEWERVNAKPRPTLKELLLSDKYYRGDLNIPSRRDVPASKADI